MNAVTFFADVNDEQVIRPPADVHLPLGAMEVTIRPVRAEAAKASAESANQSLRRCRVSLGRPTGTDNDAIDADLALAYGDDVNPPASPGKP